VFLTHLLDAQAERCPPFRVFFALTDVARGSLGEIKPVFLNGSEKTERRTTPAGGDFTTG
jgi:hypothetical protein